MAIRSVLRTRSFGVHGVDKRKVGIGCEKNRVCEYFGHLDKASISKAHRRILVFLDQLEDLIDVLSEVEGADDCLSPQQGRKCGLARNADEMGCFGQYQFTGLPWWRQALSRGDGPSMMGVAPT